MKQELRDHREFLVSLGIDEALLLIPEWLQPLEGQDLEQPER